MSSWNDRWRGAYSEHNPFAGFDKCEVCGEVVGIGGVKIVHLIGEELVTCPECYKVVYDFENELEERIHPKSRPQKVA